MRTLIAIPAFNCADTIRSSLESCAAQTAPADVIVVDNASTDGTAAVVAEIAAAARPAAHARPVTSGDGANIRLVVNERNLGRVGNWNRCLDLLHEGGHDVLHLLFCGDTLKPDCVARVQAAFAAHPRAGAVFWPYEFHRDGRVEIVRLYESTRYLPPDELDEQNIRGGSRLGAIVCNAYARAAIGGVRFNDAFIGKHDFDLQVLRGRGAVYVDEVLSAFHVQHHRTFASAENNFRVRIEACLNRAAALERCKDSLPVRKFKELRARIAADLLRENLPLVETRELAEVLAQTSRELAGRAAARVSPAHWAAGREGASPPKTRGTPGSH